MFDATAALIEANRAVAEGDRGDGPHKTVVIERTFDGALGDVWEACTMAERLARWFLPVTGDLRVGGSFDIQGNAHGEVLECEPPHRALVTWRFGDGLSWLELRLTAVDADRTHVQLRHTAPLDAHWQRFGPGATGVGWDMALLALPLHLSTGEPVDPGEGMAWTISPDGIAFTQESAHLWGIADEAGGEDPAQARAAADATAAAYTGA